MNKLQLAIVIFAVSLGVIGCSQQNNPIESTTSQSNASQIVSQLPKGLPTSMTSPIFVAMPRPKTKIAGTSITAFVQADSGAVLVLKTNYDGVIGPVKVTLKLSIPQKSLSNDTYITMSMDTLRLGLNVTFGPHGTTFLKPAKLDVNASGLDLAGFANGASQNDCFYIVDGQWAGDQQASKIQVNLNQGTLYASNVLLNHFSQYGFGRRTAN